MEYLVNTPADRKEMLKKLSLSSLDELFADIPAKLRDPKLELPPAMGEPELVGLAGELSGANTAAKKLCFLGAGVYDHYVPAAVEELLGRGEFYTAYTPYQAEMSQGILQAIYEYQSMVCRLTGMDSANASLYDAGTACWEALIMALAKKKERRVIVSAAVNPHYRQVIETYATATGTEVLTPALCEGVDDPDELKKLLEKKPGAYLVQYPDFFGRINDIAKAAELIHTAGGHLVVAANIISLGLLKAPAELGADIVVAEGQLLGNHMNYGGPLLGVMAAKSEFLRRMPGRIAGATTDAKGRRGFVLTLQAREQHIRRERATSNICTNQALCMLAFSIHLALLGSRGIKRLATLNLSKAEYLRTAITKLPGFSVPFKDLFFNEFPVRSEQPVDKVLAALGEAGILGGIALGKYYAEMKDSFLVCVTEKRTKHDLDRYIKIVASC